MPIILGAHACSPDQPRVAEYWQDILSSRGPALQSTRALLTV
jgi:hypothetical protein